MLLVVRTGNDTNGGMPGGAACSLAIEWSVAGFEGQLNGVGGNVNTGFQLTNFWGGFAGVSIDNNFYETGALRGGPALAVDLSYGGWIGFNSDGRKDVSVWAELNLGRTPSDGSHRIGVTAGMSAQIRSNLELSLDGFTAWRELGTQFVADPIDNMDTPQWLFATIAQREMSLTLRGSWTFTPDLSLQVYAQPFLSVGAYRGYKLAAATRAADYADRFTELAWHWAS